MFSTKLSTISAFAGALAVSLGSLVPAASSGPLSQIEGSAKYVPIQSISYEFGSKSMSGYFVQQASTCLVTLMIIEKSDPKQLLPLTPTRVRLLLNPGQSAGLDSEEGRSLNLTCGEGAGTLLVDFGERAKLMALQTAATHKSVAERR